MQTQSATSHSQHQTPPRTAARARKGAGFSLIELLIVIAIVSILAALAYPAYIKQIIRGQRTSGQNFIMDLAQRNEQFFLDNKAYATTMAQLGYAALPAEVAPYYQLPAVAQVAAGANTTVGYNISMAPAASTRLAIANDGTLWVNNLGQRYRSIRGNVTYVAGEDCTFEDGTCVPN
jgi:type IV pilus assembly protein PilE